MVTRQAGQPKSILILGGTAEARSLAAGLIGLGFDVSSSLAGRTQAPLHPPGAVRVGGFGGAAGLARYLQENSFTHLVDATHPYAAAISRNAIEAAQSTGVPLLRLMRPPWTPARDAVWLDVAGADEAATALPAGASVLLTTGHADLQTYLQRSDCRFVIRVIEKPVLTLPDHARLLVSRPPYDLAKELALMRDCAITHLVAKNSGGGQTAAKLEAANALGVTTIMLARPHYASAPEVESVEAALAVLSA